MKKSGSKTKSWRELGQGMTEYIIIVALIAIGTIAVVTLFGNNIRALFGSSASALAGAENADVKGTTFEGEVGKNLENFADGTHEP